MKSFVYLAMLRRGEKDREKGEDGRDKKKTIGKQGWKAKEKEERKRELMNSSGRWDPICAFPSSSFPLATMAAQVP